MINIFWIRIRYKYQSRSTGFEIKHLPVPAPTKQSSFLCQFWPDLICRSTGSSGLPATWESHWNKKFFQGQWKVWEFCKMVREILDNKKRLGNFMIFALKSLESLSVVVQIFTSLLYPWHLCYSFRLSIRAFVEFTTKISQSCVKVGYIIRTTRQKAFIFRP